MKIRLIKQYKANPSGSILETDKGMASKLVQEGYASYNMEIPKARNKMVSTFGKRKIYRKRKRRKAK